MILHTTQNNKLLVVNTDAARKMKNDTISNKHYIDSCPKLKPNEDLAFGALDNFLPAAQVKLESDDALTNDLWEHTY